MNIPKKCKNCDYCEPYGIYLSKYPECMYYKEECETAVINCEISNVKSFDIDKETELNFNNINFDDY